MRRLTGSIIQNSARWRAVLEFSARKVGPKVYTLLSEHAKFSTYRGTRKGAVNTGMWQQGRSGSTA
jgi:hypothetical protein